MLECQRQLLSIRRIENGIAVNTNLEKSTSAVSLSSVICSIADRVTGERIRACNVPPPYGTQM
jgi:hypothetical protein